LSQETLTKIFFISKNVNIYGRMHVQGKQGLSQLDKKIIGILLITLLAIVLIVSNIYLLFNQPYQNANNPSPTPIPTPTSPTPTPEPTSMPTASVTAVLNATQIADTYSLLVNGTVTNNSPNTAYDVGLHVTAVGIPFTSYETLIDMTVPIASAEYVQSSILGTVKHPLSTLTPYQSVPVEITIISLYQSRTPTLLPPINITLVWSNTP
jgi:hypothetical protein